MEDQFDSNEITTKPSPKFSWGHILIILLVAIIAGGGVWAYYKYKVLPDLEKKNQAPVITDKTADWETYTNDTLNYTLKIPKDWQSIDGQKFTKPINVAYFTSKDNAFTDSPTLAQLTDNPTISIEVAQTIGSMKTGDELTKDIVTNFLGKNLVGDVTDAKVGKDKLAGFRAKSNAILDGKSGYVLESIYFQDAQKTNVFEYKLYHSDSKTKITENFNLIISTFKFTK
jgi:hypothetical protein